MAVDMFLEIDGVKGESKDSKHAGKIDVLAWSWGASNSGTSHSGGGSGAGKVNVQDISLTKYVDKSSPVLFLGCASGKHYSKAELIVRKAGEKPLEYLKYKLSDVMVTSISTGGSGGEDRLTENIALNFAKIQIEYFEQKPDGSSAGSTPAGWDIKANAKA